jgi:hypothetical protein
MGYQVKLSRWLLRRLSEQADAGSATSLTCAQAILLMLNEPRLASVCSFGPPCGFFTVAVMMQRTTLNRPNRLLELLFPA